MRYVSRRRLRLLLGLPLALFPAGTLSAQDAAPPSANRYWQDNPRPAQWVAPAQPQICVNRGSNDDPTSSARNKSVAAYVTVQVPTNLNISASGWAESGEADGTVAVEILKDNIVIAQSDPQSGQGVVHANVSTSAQVDPNHESKISARLVGQGKTYRFVRLRATTATALLCPF